MKKFLFTLSVLTFFNSANAQNWTQVSNNILKGKNSNSEFNNSKVYSMDATNLKNKLASAPSSTSSQTGAVIDMPTSDGNIQKFMVWEASILSPKLQEKYPNIKSYVGKSLENPSVYLRFSVTPLGFSSSIFRNDGNSDFIDSHDVNGNTFYEVHSSSKANSNFVCSTNELISKHQTNDESVNIANKANDKVFRTYRLALSVPGEYTAYFGGTKEKALAAMTNTMTRVNGVFEKDMALNFQLVDDTNDLIFTDSTTDPYSAPSKGMSDDPTYGGAPYYLSTWQVELQSYLTNSFGEAKYDIGHFFGSSGGGGNAGCIGCICDTTFPDGKGSGMTSPSNGIPSGDKFDIDYVAHEIGHQIGANHTYSHIYEGTGVNVEPGSGSTIMGYAGITAYNVQSNSDDYFTYRSILQVQNNLKNKTCGIQKPILNTPPKIELVKTSYTIPISTAFKLDAKITDAENDAFLTTWEQNNSGNSTTEDGNSRVKQTKTVGPNFRSFAPVKETYRYFPKFSSILTNKLLHTGTGNSVWESVTSVARNYDFTVTARDYNPQGPQTNTASVRVIASNAAGPFIVNTPNDTENKLMLNVSNFDVTWNVANTNIAPVNTAKVKVSISWDNGSTFEELGVVDNTGTANFTLPANAKDVTNGYIMIEAVDNVYLAVKKFSTGTLATKELDAKKSLIYPNPSNGSFTIEQKTSGKVSVEIIDLNGRTVYTSSENASGNFKKQIDTKLPAGVYVVKVSSDEGQSTSKLIIK